ncbi:MAG: hypothetical protein QXI93_02825 [Candidatus Methanomethylicia archaeon]
MEVYAMYDKQLMSLLNEIKFIKCEKCNSHLEFYKLYIEESKISEVNISLLCFKCGLQYEYKFLGAGVFGLKEVKEIKASSWDELFKSLES